MLVRDPRPSEKKGINEYLEAEKEAGIYEVAQESERIVETTKGHSARKFHQAVAKHAQPSSSKGGSRRKKAQKGSETEVPLQGAFQSGLGLGV